MSNLLLHLSAWYDTQNPRVTVSLSLQEKQGRRFVEGPLGATAPWKQVAQHRTAACLQGIFVDIQEMHKIKHFSSRGAGATSSTDPAEEVINFVFVLFFFLPLILLFQTWQTFFRGFSAMTNACYDFAFQIFNGERESVQYVAGLVEYHPLTHSGLSEIGQREQFLPFWQITPKIY